LPIIFCKRCLYSSTHPLGLVIDENGICSGCRVHEEKDSLDWAHRWSRLESIVAPYRSKTKAVYDCIVPVSGAQDSYFMVHLVKNLLGLNPLLVAYNKYWNTPLGVRNLANLRVRFNCDILIQNVNPISVKKITKTTLRRLGSIYWHCIAGQTVFPVQTAVRMKIPLIIWGGHQGTEQTGMFSHEHEVEMTRRYRKDHDLMGFEADDLLSNFDLLSEGDVWQYRYPDDDDLNETGIRGIYLSNFVRWDPKAQHEQMIDLYDYQTSHFSRTFDCYDFVDCYNYMNLHDEIKLLKHGYSKVVDHASREIRHGRVSRETALGLVQKHYRSEAQYVDLFCEWLGVEQRSLQLVLDLHRNQDIWKRGQSGAWVMSQQLPWSGVDSDMDLSTNPSFIENCHLSREFDDGYITIGKGWP
jgi:N-acetyl sugar amidotransferase